MRTEKNATFRAVIVSAALISLALGAHPSASHGQSIQACYHDRTGQLRRVLSAGDCSKHESAISWNEVGPAGPQGPAGAQGEAGAVGPAGPAGSDATAPTFTPSCPGEVAHVNVCQGAVCHDMAWPCAPYKCNEDGTTCAEDCEAFSDCAQGAHCDTITKKCAFQGTTCEDDFTVRNANGQLESCAPYVCVAGACQQQCSSTSIDCVPGATCVDGRCIEAP